MIARNSPVQHPTLPGDQPFARDYPALLIVGGGLLAVSLFVGEAGLYPLIFADEYIYSKYTRLLPFSHADVPNYLYFLIYSGTSVCGDQFLVCARFLNILFFAAALPFVYAVACGVTQPRNAVFIALLALTSAISTYTAYFMPESLYFLGFWIYVLLLVRSRRGHYLRHCWLTGAVLGALTLIKPHAIFLLPATLAYLFLTAPQHTPEAAGRFVRIKGLVALVTIALAVKFVLGWLLAGKAGLSLFGAAYQGMATSTLDDMERMWSMALPVLHSLSGHVQALVLMFGVSIAAAGHRLWVSLGHQRGGVAARGAGLDLFTGLVLLTMLPVVAVFTASIAGTGVYESIGRLHMRYYNFALPLLLMLAAPARPTDVPCDPLRVRLMIGLPLLGVIAYAGVTQLAGYQPSLIDSPELRGFTVKASLFGVLSTLSCLALTVWMVSRQQGQRLYFYCFLPVSVLLSSGLVHAEIYHGRLVADAYDQAGLFVRHYLPPAERARTTVIGKDLSALYRTLFYFDAPEANFMHVPSGASLDGVELSSQVQDWILLVGTNQVPRGVDRALVLNDFVLAHRLKPWRIDFKKSTWPELLQHAEGLSGPEVWGTWSDGRQVRLDFKYPLPNRFRVRLVARAYGPNVGQPIIFQAGTASHTVKLGEEVREHSWLMDNPALTNRLEILIPVPASPRDRGESSDARLLGIGLTVLEVQPADIE